MHGTAQYNFFVLRCQINFQNSIHIKGNKTAAQLTIIHEIKVVDKVGKNVRIVLHKLILNFSWQLRVSRLNRFITDTAKAKFITDLFQTILTGAFRVP